MIRLKRPSAVPPEWQKKADKATQVLWQQWQNKQPLDIRRSVYAHPLVKRALLKAQHEKCAYCETPLLRQPGHVEHFRPKKGWKQKAGDTLRAPGYFWLAYVWKNLCVSCSACNDEAHKSNLFPLAKGSMRASPDKPDLSKERPLLLSPFEDQPDDHIHWRTHQPIPKNGSKRGKTTIDIFGLKSDRRLSEWRRGYLRTLRHTVIELEKDVYPTLIRERKLRELARSVSDSAPYAAMIRSKLGKRIKALLSTQKQPN